MIEFFNEDCFERFKKLEDNSVDAIVTDPPYGISFSGKTSNTNWDNLSDKDYYELLCTFFLECQRVLKTGGTLWMCFGRTKIQTVFQALNDFDKDKRVENDRLQVNLENQTVYCDGKNTYELFHITKGEKYIWNQIEIKRDVIAPYVLNGQKRGWDYEKGQPKRWTTLGNVIFSSSFEFLKQSLLLISSKEESNCISLPTFERIERNYEMLKNQVSTSENCRLSFSQRSFLPKTS